MIPGCDGAGIVEAVGSDVTEFNPGDRVVTFVAPRLVEKRGDDALAGVEDAIACLGQAVDGTLRSHGVFSEAGLVHAPRSLTSLTAATLTCTWTTAWNCLFGVKGREVGPGSWVLIQGTGGVSIATLQIAVAAGATVVATTSSEEKSIRLKTLGASHVINYRTSPDIWGQEAKKLTPDGRGLDFVVDVGGNETLPQALAAVRVDGIVLVVGGVGKDDADVVPMISALIHTCIVRGILASSRSQFRELVQFIEEKRIIPAVDEVVFELKDAKDAYRRLKEQKHFSKVLIEVNHD